jgi:hypothetical protein
MNKTGSDYLRQAFDDFKNQQEPPQELKVKNKVLHQENDILKD